MGRACAVPKCKTGYKSVKEKCSAFTVPKNPEQFKKWQAAIPGIVLRQSQSVCEKHFQEKCIIRECVMHDSLGRIIAKVPYMHPRLVEGAVPTIFNNFTVSVRPVSKKRTDVEFDGSNSLEDQCSSLKKPLSGPDETIQHEGLPLILVRRELPCASQKTMMHEVLPVALVHRTSPCALRKTIQHKVIPVASVPRASPCAPDETIQQDVRPVRLVCEASPCAPEQTIQQDVLPVASVPGASPCAPEETIQQDVLPVTLVSGASPCGPEETIQQEVLKVKSVHETTLCAKPCAPQETIQREVLPLKLASKATTGSLNQKVVNPASNVTNFVLSQGTIENLTSNVVNGENNPITLPKSWGVTEYQEKRGQRVIFSRIRRKNASTFIDKSVDVEADKILRYRVYGRLIDSEKFELPSVLTDTTQLPKTLEKFQRLNVCEGLSPVNIHHLPVDAVFQDSVQRWHDNDCPMITKLKRCEQCKKMRERTRRREVRMDKTETIHRIRQLSNPIDRRKLINLRKTIAREKRANNYLKRRVQLLTESLKGKAKKISSSHVETLEDDYLLLLVPEDDQNVNEDEIIYNT